MTCDRTLLLGDDRLYRQGAYTALSRGRERNDLYIVVEDDRDTVAELEDHGRVVIDHPVDRLVTALRRDGAKTLATDEVDEIPHVEQCASLGDLWSEDEHLVAALTSDPASEFAIPIDID